MILVNETINIFKTLAKDLEGEVRVQGAKNIYNFANGLPAESKKNLTMTHIIPLIKDLSNGKSRFQHSLAQQF